MKLLGQDLNVLHNQLTALIQNILAWSASFVAHQKKAILPPSTDRCVSIPGPGGLDKLQVVPLDGRITVGYNVPGYAPGPFVSREQQDAKAFGPDLVVVNVTHFSVNYADVCIRWGLYESALRYVGWPIVPGFDFSGTVEWAGAESGFQIGEKVFGFTMFGAYTCRLLVPCSQIRKTPSKVPQEDIAGLPAVAATALHAVSLAGAWPQQLVTINKAALIHSAAGGVGSMLIQMCKARGFSPIVAVVGGTHKIEFCRDLGADVVIDKSKSKDLWKEVSAASPSGYVAIFDANGVETISQSYEHLARCGKIVLYGFHSNIPKAQVTSTHTHIHTHAHTHTHLAASEQ